MFGRVEARIKETLGKVDLWDEIETQRILTSNEMKNKLDVLDWKSVQSGSF